MSMLKLSASLTGQPIISLRTGGIVGRTTKPLINPHNLKIEGFYCNDSRSSQQLILLIQDIRDFVPNGIAVNDFDALSEPSELIRLKEVIDLEFEIIGKLAQTSKKRRLGKINDYAIDDQGFFIQKLYVERSLLKSISSDRLMIDRTDIVEVTDKRVIIREIERRAKSGVAAPVAA